MKLLLPKIVIPIEQDQQEQYRQAAANILHIAPRDIRIDKILSKDLDLRNQEQFSYKLVLVVEVADDIQKPKEIPLYQEPVETFPQPLELDQQPIVIGFGPAGMFAALELLARGCKPIIFERGKKIGERSQDVQRFIREKVLNPESNIQYGEGGAGSYSDGKLFSRRNNNTGFINDVLKTFIQFGAPAEIEYISKPHLGTDVLCKIVRNIRNYILENGGEIHYNSQLTDLILNERKLVGIKINDRQIYHTDALFRACGHSARDTYPMLEQQQVAMEQRPISIGVRIDHPVEEINLFRYGKKYHNFDKLGAATYSISHTNRTIRKGVYTFCMCPGGEIVNASSEPGRLVVNGMSYSKRDGNFSNAALVVTCHTSDYPTDSPLAGIELQREIEQKAYQATEGSWRAPGQNLLDFIANKESTKLNPSSFTMGLSPYNLRNILPQFIVDELLAAFAKWQKEMPLFISKNAVLVGVETRTSSPVRIIRNSFYESVNTPGLYPIGEGSGHTGGITSSAADGIKAIDKFAAQQTEKP